MSRETEVADFDHAPLRQQKIFRLDVAVNVALHVHTYMYSCTYMSESMYISVLLNVCLFDATSICGFADKHINMFYRQCAVPVPEATLFIII
jgi:hypothetical protein